MEEGSERFSRIERMIGAEGVARLHGAFVTVIGLGAVGSYATEALARAGIGRLRLVDFDLIRASNRNRQLYALASTEGRPKVEVAAARVRDINPDCQVEVLQEFVHVETLARVLLGPPNVVVDAIDSYTPKVELLCAAVAQGLPLISSMGAALRTDPAQVRVGPLVKSAGCPLARRLRKELRKRGVPLDLTCVYSDEPVDDRFVTVDTGDEVDIIERGRKRRILGSLPTLTGIFGLTVANEALKMILGDVFPGKNSRA